MRMFLLFLAVPLQLYAADCYVGVGGGKSSVGISGIDRLEARVFTSGYANGTADEDKTSTTTEFQFGCVLSRRYGLKAELGIIEGFKHVVHTEGTVTFGGFSADFTADRVVRARGYMLSGIWEHQLSRRTYVFGRVGAVYAKATADIYPLGSEYAVHAEKEGLVPVLGLGGRFTIDDRWSATGEYRIAGHPKIKEGLLSFQYSFR